MHEVHFIHVGVSRRVELLVRLPAKPNKTEEATLYALMVQAVLLVDSSGSMRTVEAELFNSLIDFYIWPDSVSVRNAPDEANTLFRTGKSCHELTERLVPAIIKEMGEDGTGAFFYDFYRPFVGAEQQGCPPASFSFYKVQEKGRIRAVSLTTDRENGYATAFFSAFARGDGRLLRTREREIQKEDACYMKMPYFNLMPLLYYAGRIHTAVSLCWYMEKVRPVPYCSL